MTIYRSIARFAIACMILMWAAGASAQWARVSSRPLGGATVNAAMNYKEGIVWAGASGLCYSRDSGASWQQCTNFPNDPIKDIAFFDSLTGLVATSNSVYKTTNAGTTWKKIFSGVQIRKVSFHRSPLILHVAEAPGGVSTSTDGGTTWNTANVGGDCRCIAVAIDGTLYAITAVQNSAGYVGVLHSSSDLGSSWNTVGNNFFGDCYTISADSCDAKRLYVINEQIFIPSDSTPRMYVSTDAGASWMVTHAYNGLYYSGAMATTTFNVFIGSMSGDGLSRSRDDGMTWTVIHGPPTAPDTRGITAADGNLVFALDTNGYVWRTTNGGGISSDDPYRPGTIALDQTSLFDKDTAICDSIERTVNVLRSDCTSPYVASITIDGPDSDSYHIVGNAEGSITLSFVPKDTGSLPARLVVRMTNGWTETVDLRGYSRSDPGSLDLTPRSLFANDTITCNTLERMISIGARGCRPPSIASFKFIGPDSLDYRVSTLKTDTIGVELLLRKTGDQHGSLVLMLSNGETDTIALGGYWRTDGPFVNSAIERTPPTDSLFPCEKPATIWLRLNTTACPFPDFVSEQMTGANASDYTIVKGMALPFGAEDSVEIQFLPQDTGWRTANYEFLLSNGRTISIPIRSYGKPKQMLSLGTTNLTAKTIGETIAVPISVNGLTKKEDIDLIVHYDPHVFDYVRSTNMLGASVDIAGDAWPGRAHVFFRNCGTASLIGYAYLTCWADSTRGREPVTFDSVQVPSAIGPCVYAVEPPQASTTIALPSGCGTSILSDVVRYGKMPSFSIVPNPTSGDATLTSTLDLASATISIYDMLGNERLRFTTSLKHGESHPLSMPSESGLYYVKITSLAGVRSLGVIVSR